MVKPEDKGARTLILKYVTPADSGNFECQVSTVPKKAITFHLQVVGESSTENVFGIWIDKKMGLIIHDDSSTEN